MFLYLLQDDRRVVSAGSGRVLTVDRHPPDTSVGSLTIPSPSLSDSGNYTCAPASLSQASVMLHVLSGELSWLRDWRDGWLAGTEGCFHSASILFYYCALALLSFLFLRYSLI